MATLHIRARSARVSPSSVRVRFAALRCRREWAIAARYALVPRNRGKPRLARSATMASNPHPAMFKKYRPFACPTSTDRAVPCTNASTEACKSVPRPRQRAKSLPVPSGSKPSAAPVPTNPFRTSFSVPSPPAAATMSAPSAAACRASSLPCPRCAVSAICQCIGAGAFCTAAWSRRSSSPRRFPPCPRPDLGFKITVMFGMAFNAVSGASVPAVKLRGDSGHRRVGSAASKCYTVR